MRMFSGYSVRTRRRIRTFASKSRDGAGSWAKRPKGSRPRTSWPEPRPTDWRADVGVKSWKDREARGARAIRRRAVDDVRVEDGDLPGAELHAHGAARVDLAHPGDPAVGLPRILHEVEGPYAVVAPRDQRQAPVRHGRLGDRDVDDRGGGLDHDARGVLMPAIVGARLRLLDPEHRVRQEEILAQEVGHDIEQPGMRRIRIDPVEQEVALDVEGPVPVEGMRRLKPLRGLPESRALGRTEDGDPREVPLLAKLLDLGGRERHGRPS